ncbi:MAG: phytanoyl-CoA dioxygenase family protein [Gammaproteobacteria bacterium]
MILMPCDDFAGARAILDSEGVAILRGVLSPTEIADVRSRLFEACAKSEADGVPTRGYAFDPDQQNRRVFHLFNLDPVFIDLVQRPLALDFVRHLLGEDFLISNFSANITAPGSACMQLHADQGYVPPPWPDYPYACNVAWVLDDLTDENGGTRFVPASHRRGHGPEAGRDYDSVAIEAPAGSLLVMDGRLWHQTGANHSRACERAVLFGYYVLRWLRPQVSWNTMLWPETVAALEPGFLHLLGYYTGNVEFQIPHGQRAAHRPPPGLAGDLAAFALGARERRG